MPRLTTIAIDSQLGDPPPQWTAVWVQHRLREAYSIERRLPAIRRAPIANAWPATVDEFADLVGRTDDHREVVLKSWEKSLGVSAEDITRMEQAHDWLLTMLAPYPQERLCLAHWAAAIAYRRSLRKLMAKRRWSRTTFYRHVTAGAYIIALELERQRRPVT